jgi:outer membrane protein OmpA-like peptidoglycan-associated protein
MIAFPRMTRAASLAAVTIATLCTSSADAAERIPHDYVTDSARAAPRTSMTRQCIRTGLPDAGAPAADCDGEANVAAPSAAPASAPAAPPSAAAAPAPEDVPATSPAAGAAASEREAVPATPPAATAAVPEPEPVPALEAPAAETEQSGTLGSGRTGETSSLAEEEETATDAEREPAPVQAEPATPPETPLRVARVTLNADADFDFDKSELRPSGRVKLDELAEQLRTLDYDTITVVGHADRIGTAEYNRNLSLQRAQTVKDYLVSRQIDRERIETRGVGSSEPVTSLQDCQGLRKQQLVRCLQADRRVEVAAEATKVEGQ